MFVIPLITLGLVLGLFFYMVSASEDPSAPGCAVHGGAFILIDQQKRNKGYYNGIVAKEVDQLIHDLPLLLKEDKKTVEL